jgi:hypothetical protein
MIMFGSITHGHQKTQKGYKDIMPGLCQVYARFMPGLCLGV